MENLTGADAPMDLSASAGGMVACSLLEDSDAVIEDEDAVIEDEDAVIEDDVLYMNDAELLGADHPDMQELLQRDATFMLGNLYGQRDRRNTLDGDWKATTMPWLAWLLGQDKGKNSWGLSRHPENKTKEGASIVLAEAIDGARTDSAIQTMYAVGLDIDSGAKLDDVLARLKELGLFAIVYTSHSHGKDTLVLKHDDIMRKMKLDESPNRAEIQQYLREHHKDRFDEDYIQSIEIEELRHQTKDGLRTILKTRPLDKFRVILPLWEPVKLADLGATVNQWKEVWADAVTGVGVNMLGVSFDATCSDVNRLFFTPRHPPGADWYSAIVQGRPLRFEEIEPYSKARYVKERDPGDPFAAGADLGGDTGKRERFSTPNGKDMNDWHRKHKERFLITDVLESFCDDKIRVAGGEKAGTTHLECPFEHEHSTEGGTATMAMNPDETEAGYWTVFCRHDSCQGRDKLEFVKEMLEQNWFEESLLWDEEWNIPLPDEDLPDETAEDGTPKTPDKIAAAFTNMTTEAELRKFMRKQIKMKADVPTKERLIAAVSASTGIRKPDARKMWQEEEAKLCREGPQDAKCDFSIVNRDDYADQVEHALKGLKAAHENEPKLFRYGTEIGRISRVPETGEVSIDIIKTVEGMRAEINKVASFATAFKTDNGEGWRGISCPKDVAGDIYSGGHDLPLPFLRRTVNYPLFDTDLNLLRTDGYHRSAHLFMHLPDDLDFPDVPEDPSDEELTEAKRFIVQELAGDFPFDGCTRRELEVSCGVTAPNPGEDAAPVPPSFLNFVAFLLQTMTRPAIGPNPVPALFVTKPESGTGATLLVELAQMIAIGKTSTRPTLPNNEEERRKTIFAALRNGAAFVILDNITGELDSPVLASFLTSRMFTDRVLGRNDERSVPNDASTVMTGNNPVATKEILRRLSLCNLDARTDRPDLRDGFRHENIEEWVPKNRGRILWALAVLVMNWKAKGCPKPSGKPLKSFTDWYRVTGGIIEAAGWQGFQSNRDVLYEQSGSGDDDAMLDLIARWFEAACGSSTPFELSLEEAYVNVLAEFATALDMSLPDVRRKKNPEGDVVFDPASLGRFLTANKGRVFDVDGTRVQLEKCKRTKEGQPWALKVLPDKGEGSGKA